jgi:hypothetical protein
MNVGVRALVLKPPPFPWVATHEDITEQRRIKAALERSNRERPPIMAKNA